MKGNINMYGYSIILGLLEKISKHKTKGLVSLRVLWLHLKEQKTLNIRSDAKLTISYERRDSRGFGG